MLKQHQYQNNKYDHLKKCIWECISGMIIDADLVLEIDVSVEEVWVMFCCIYIYRTILNSNNIIQSNLWKRNDDIKTETREVQHYSKIFFCQVQTRTQWNNDGKIVKFLWCFLLYKYVVNHSGPTVFGFGGFKLKRIGICPFAVVNRGWPSHSESITLE